jgi:hypothetical protein
MSKLFHELLLQHVVNLLQQHGQHRKCLNLQNTTNRRSVELHYSAIEKEFRDKECKQKGNIMFCNGVHTCVARSPVANQESTIFAPLFMHLSNLS